MLSHARQLMLMTAINLVSGLSPAVVTAQQAASQAYASLPVSAHEPAASGISILTYNVKGLPWPIATGRDQAIRDIGDRLASLRKEGRQPDIVVLQEAFGDTAREIANRAGYRHIALGPDAVSQPRYRFAKTLPRDWTRGEGVGKSLDSGLAIVSDYPIRSIETLAFGDQACAGFDCLANKGIMKVEVYLPGSDQRVQIFNVHLNSRKASSVAVDKANRALQRQLLLVSRFMREKADPAMPMIVAGDFNLGSDKSRRIAFAGVAASEPRLAFMRLDHASAARALRQGLTAGREANADMAAIVRRSKDLIFSDSSLKPVAASVPFGTEPDGSALSDHFGYRIDYALSPERRVQPIRIAANGGDPIARKISLR